MIFYFSATGNSKAVAEKLQAGVGGNLLRIDDALRRKEFVHNIPEGEDVFFVYPIYFFSMPTVVEDFIKNLKLESQGNIVNVCAVITCGGMIGGAEKYFAKQFKNKGNITIKGFYKIRSVDNYIFLSKAPLNEEMVMRLRRADKETEAAIESIKFNYRAPYKSGAFMGIVSILANKLYKATNKTSPFHVNKDTCIKCGLCQFHCPVSAIKMQDGQPVWVKERCTHCLACIHRCPAVAIDYGTKTQDKGRYVNPILK